MAVIKLNRTKTGVVPTALEDGELYIDQLNDKLYWADATGVIRNIDLKLVFTGDVTKDAFSSTTVIADNAVTFAKMATAAVSTAAEFLANTASKLLSAQTVWNAATFKTITWSASVTLDLNTLINGSVTLTGNTTLANPTNGKPGQTGSIIISNPSGYTLSVGTAWKTVGAIAPNLVTGTNRLDYLVVDATTIHYQIARGIS